MTRRRDTVFAHRYAACFGDFLGHFVFGQDAAVAGFGALAHLDFNHAYLRVLRLRGKALRVKAAIGCAAAEVAAAQFPRQIAAVLTVISTDAAFACVVGKVTELGTFVECPNGVGTQRAKTHGRDIEDRRRVRLRALRATHDNSKAAGVGQGRGAHGVADKFEAGLVHINQCAERFVSAFILGPRIHQ